MKLLPDRLLNSCERYLSQYQFIAGQLRGLIYRSMCPQLVKHSYVSRSLVDYGMITSWNDGVAVVVVVVVIVVGVGGVVVVVDDDDVDDDILLLFLCRLCAKFWILPLVGTQKR